VEEANLAKRHVAFIGLGSVGAPIALALARAGVGRFTLLDPDRFSVPNVARHVGDARDLGRRKDRLLRERLLACHPTATVQCLEADVCAPEDGATLESHLNDADLLVVTTDAPAANLAANRLAIGLQTRALFVGIYEGGTGGEIFAYRPEQEACYACVAAFRAALPPVPRVHRAHDYVNLRKGAELPPLNALGIDIGHTVSVSASVALGLLEEPGRLEGILTPDKPLLFVANGVPGWIFDRPFELIPASLPEAGCQVCRQVTQLEPASEAPLIWQDERDVEDMPPTAESPSRQALNEQQPATTPVPHLATGTVAPLFFPEPADDTTPPPATMSAGGDGSEIGAPLVEDLTIRDLEAPEACPPGEVARAAEDGTAPRAVPPGTALPKALTAQETEKVTTAGADDDAAKTEDSHAHLTREMTRWAPGALAVAEGGRATVPIDGELLEEAYHTDWGPPNPELDGNDAEADIAPIEDEGPEAQEPWNDAQSSEEEAGDDLPDYFEPVGKDDAGGQMAIGKDDAEGLPVGKTDAEGPPVGKDDAEGQTPVGKDDATDDEDAGFSGRGFLGLVRWFGVELRSAFQPTSPGTARDAAYEGRGEGPTEGGPSQPGAHPPRVTRQQLGLPMDEHRPPPLPEEGAGGTQSRGLFRG